MKKPENVKLDDYAVSVSGWDFECFSLSEIIDDKVNEYSEKDIKEMFQIGYALFQHKKGIRNDPNI